MPSASRKPIRVGYLHGRGSTAETNKATFLRDYRDPETGEPAFEVVAETYATDSLKDAVEWADGWLERAGKLDVLAGSSFGGAVAVHLLRRGAWTGPTLLLAQAYTLYTGERKTLAEGLPPGRTVTLIHGTVDSIVPCSGSRVLATTGTPETVQLVEIEDEHRLEKLTGELAPVYVDAVVELARAGGWSPDP
ncbi:hypothetical protein DFJ74DRAFT_672942 [Hyaloraphidium curvatum]|nr:hypothetical protein DFJ74DRAFT_672942 [Hyaloraphidium curvatum]